MKKSSENTTVHKNRKLGNGYYSMSFGPLSWTARANPGQFVHIQLPQSDLLFRRAMSIAGIDQKNSTAEIIFKTVGRGTFQLADYRAGSTLNILGPLGNKFSYPRKNELSLLIAGGIGFPPLFYFASSMVRRGHDPKSIHFFYGGRSSDDILEKSRIKKTGCNFHPVTEDGSLGKKGLVTRAVEELIGSTGNKKIRLYSCGPNAMLKAVDEIGMRHDLPGQLSLEAPMPCGFGVCLGCVVPLRRGGHARVCHEGPVFSIGEVLL